MRIFICSMIEYPRSSATANYIQYLASALNSVGNEVVIIAKINKEVELENSYIYKGVKVKEPYLYTEKKGIRHFIFWHSLGVQKSYEISLMHQKCTDQDLIIVYSHTREIHEAAFNIRKKIGAKTACCVTEWFEKKDCRSEKDYKEFEYYFNVLIPQHDLIFPISTKIEKHFAELGKKTLCLPIMADTEEFINIKKKHGKKKVIYPANGQMKDSLEDMLNAITNLDEVLKANFEFHITGVSKDTIREIMQDRFSEMSKNIIIHKWLVYDELVSLYQEMHFLLIAREKSLMTESNFPSKVPEVMCYGVVPIVSRVGDYTKYYLKDNENSIIFDGGDSKSCYEALERALRLSDDEYNRLSQNARKCAENKFDYHNWAFKIQENIQKLY